MKLISHRGNISGPSFGENSPLKIEKAISMGFDVEIDVWKFKEDYWLGHDYPEYNISSEFLLNESLWCHAKNLDAFTSMLASGVHCFWHQEDDYTLTSHGLIWIYPGKPICKDGVIVCKSMNSTIEMSRAEVYGICSDFVGEIK